MRITSRTMKNSLRMLPLVGLLAAPVAQAAYINVALGKPVYVVAGATSGASLATLTDGLFVAKNTQWNNASDVFWNGTGSTIEIDLGADYAIVGAIIQGDVNDVYRLEYSTSAGGPWSTAWDTPNWWNWNPNPGVGMVTRPNPDDNTQMQSLPEFTARYLRVSAPFDTSGLGDTDYALAEVQVFTVPEPSSFAVAVPGMFALAFCRRRRRFC